MDANIVLKFRVSPVFIRNILSTNKRNMERGRFVFPAIHNSSIHKFLRFKYALMLKRDMLLFFLDNQDSYEENRTM